MVSSSPKKIGRKSKQVRKPRWKRFSEALASQWEKCAEFAVNHILLSVLIGLLVLWFGVSWLVYRAEHLAPGANILSYGEGIWWGVVTFLTVGYGDRYPVTWEGRAYAGFLMFAGVVSLGIVTAKISSVFLEQAMRRGRGLVDTHRLNDHFIICGWKDEMHEVLWHILDFNPGLTSDRMVLIANLQQTVVDQLRDQPRLKGLQVVAGNYFEEASLRRAAPERARKILILADRAPGADGHVASVTEADARTIMTAMTLSHIARGTLVAAELLDPKMDQYLKLASVSEIIYSREYSRLMLANASGGTGVSNIIFDLLDPKNPTVIATHAIGEDLFESSYADFKRGFEERHPKAVVIGILENTGNRYGIKERALRQAQRTTDMDRLVTNLRSVKELKCNFPVFNPDPDYVIQEGSMAIVIESRGSVGRSGVDGALSVRGERGSHAAS